MRQFIFSLIACVIAGATYFFLKRYLGTEITSWICIFEVIPFAALSFIKYNGMTMDKFIYIFIRNKLLTPKVLFYKPINLYEELVKGDDKNVKNKKGKKRKYKNT